jgi:tRNA (cytidine32/uridine32-2'-O)-methyltransferase
MLERIKIVLVETSHPGNIGAAARAMKTMGLRDLVLVSPKHFPDAEATAMASGAGDLLESCRVVSDLKEAIADCQFVFGTTARKRDLDWPMFTSQQFSKQAQAKMSEGAEVAIVFGRERTGLTNEELWLCHAGVMIPTSADYHSLNLAQAVQIIAYECHEQFSSPLSFSHLETELVGMSAMEQFYQHLEQVLIAIEFMRADEPKRLMPKLRRLFNRCGIESSEMNILRGILNQIQKYEVR